MSAATLLLDVAAKIWANQALVAGTMWPSASAWPRLRLAHNAKLNAGLTIPGGGRALYSVIGLAMCAGLLWVIHRTPRSGQRYAWPFALVLGGGCGNVFERVIRGSVTDFIDLHMGAFNVADIAIACGLGLYLVARTRDGIREEGWNWKSVFRLEVPTLLPPSLRKTRIVGTSASSETE